MFMDTCKPIDKQNFYRYSDKNGAVPFLIKCKWDGACFDSGRSGGTTLHGWKDCKNDNANQNWTTEDPELTNKPNTFDDKFAIQGTTGNPIPNNNGVGSGQFYADMRSDRQNFAYVARACLSDSNCAAITQDIKDNTRFYFSQKPIGVTETGNINKTTDVPANDKTKWYTWVKKTSN
jgi:hypothetical protein